MSGADKVRGEGEEADREGPGRRDGEVLGKGEGANWVKSGRRGRGIRRDGDKGEGQGESEGGGGEGARVQP